MRILRRPFLLMALLCIAGGSLYGIALALSRKQEPADPESRVLTLLRREGKLSGAGWPWVLCVREVHGHALRGVVLKELGAQGEVAGVIMAAEGELRLDPKRGRMNLVLRQGVGKQGEGSKVAFEERSWDLPRPPGFETNRQ